VRCFCQIMRNPVRCVNGKHAHILSTEKAAWVEWKKSNPNLGCKSFHSFPGSARQQTAPGHFRAI
jgi:hypothetical protein